MRIKNENSQDYTVNNRKQPSELTVMCNCSKRI